MKLREARKQVGMPQYRLAGLANVPLTEIYRIERRGMRPTASQAARIARVLDVDPDVIEELRAALEGSDRDGAA